MGSSILLMGFSKVFVFVTLLVSLFQTLPLVVCVEFEVGGSQGWIIPPSKTQHLYNDWASNNRFNVGDTLHFVYKKDSVLAVTEEEYEKCRSAHPIFFSNNGNTVYILDKPDMFYFISGVSGHCERGLKMIVKVLGPVSPPQSANDTTSPAQTKSDGQTLELAAGAITVALIGFFSYVGGILF